jgi:hypothetical protein
MQVTIPEHFREFVAAQVARIGLSGPDEYIALLINHAEDQAFLASRRADPLGPPSVEEDLGMTQDEYDALLLEAVNSGPSTPMTREDWDSIRREALERLTARQPK